MEEVYKCFFITCTSCLLYLINSAIKINKRKLKFHYCVSSHLSFFVPWRKLQLTIPKVVRDTLDPVRNHDTWKLKLSNSVNKRTIVSPKVFILRNAFIIDPFNETKWFKIPILLLNYINHYYLFHCKTYIVLPYPQFPERLKWQ